MNNSKNISELFHRIINKAIEREMVPRLLGNGELLYRIEIHVIVAIGEHPEINLTELSEILGVTKSAVSQKVKVLEKKQYIERYKSSGNNKEILFKLTEKGKFVLSGHNEFHNKIDKKILNKIGNFDENVLEKFTQILNIIEQHFETL